MAKLPKKYIKAAWKTKGATKENALKRAWTAFRKSKSKSKSKSSKTSSTKRKTKSNPKGGKNRMGRKGKSLVQTAYKLVPALAMAAPGLSAAFGTGDAKYKVTTAVKYYTGYNMDLKKFIWSDFAVGWTPFVAASLAIKGIQKLNGLIRRI